MSERDEIEMIKRRLGELVVEVGQLKNDFDRAKHGLAKGFEELNKEMEKELRGNQNE